MRGRSSHTRVGNEKILNQDLKGNSLKQKNQKAKVFEYKKVSEQTPSQVRRVGKSASFVALVQKELLNYRNKQGVYNGLVDLLRKPEFLVACYEEIRGKPGNMTRGMTDETLDGIS